MTRICLVRHGETDWNVALRMQGHRDLPLNRVGEAQARAAGLAFAGASAAAVYSSDLQRARRTAAPIAEALGLPVVPLAALRERNFGRCEGMTIAEVRATYAADAEAFARRDPDYVPPGGESRRQFRDRVITCLQELVDYHPGQSIVIVTHGGVLDAVYQWIHGLPPETPRNYAIPNAGINWICIEERSCSIERWADVTHLTPVGNGPEEP